MVRDEHFYQTKWRSYYCLYIYRFILQTKITILKQNFNVSIHRQKLAKRSTGETNSVNLLFSVLQKQFMRK